MSTTDIAAEGDAALDEVNRLVDELLATCPDPAADQTTFAGEQFDRGLAWVHFPVGLGGLDLSPKYQPIINNRVFAAGATNPFQRNPMGYGMCGPTIVEWGTPEQKQKYLRRIFTAEDIWCQLFSEPGAGSDVAGLATMAVRRRRRVGAERAEGVDLARPSGAVGPDHLSDRSGGGQARRHHGVRGRHARAGRGGAPAAPDDRWGRVQRGVLHRRQGAGGRDPRSPRRRLAGEPHDADERADGDRWCDAAARFGADRLGGGAVAGAAGRGTLTGACSIG